MAEIDCLTRAKDYKGGDPALAICTHERCQGCRVVGPTAASENIPANVPPPNLVSKPSFVQSLLTRSNTVKAASAIGAPVLLRSNTMKLGSSVGPLVSNAERSTPGFAPVRKKAWGWGKKVAGKEGDIPTAETTELVAKASVPAAETSVTRVPGLETPEILIRKAADAKEELPIPEVAAVARTGWLSGAKAEAAISIAKEEPPIREAVPLGEVNPAAKPGGWWGFTRSKTELVLTAKEEQMMEATSSYEGDTTPTFEEVQLSRNYAYTPYEPPTLELPEGLQHAWECCMCKTGKLHRVRPGDESCQLLLGKTGTRCPHRRCEDCVKRVLQGIFYD